ncbi:MAG TPA: hypothetical protein VGN43_10005, partial [Steroidobacteraceae bacterium]|nr:hypothetical protein [Steroidobacteraceae bacterium]
AIGLIEQPAHDANRSRPHVQCASGCGWWLVKDTAEVVCHSVHDALQYAGPGYPGQAAGDGGGRAAARGNAFC